MTSTSTQAARGRTRAALAITAACSPSSSSPSSSSSGLYADVLWFDQLGFLDVLTTQWVARVVMFLVGFFAHGARRSGSSIEIAFRSRPVYAKLNSQLDRYQQVIEPLRRLAMYGIPIVLGIFVGVSTAEPLGTRARSTSTAPRSAQTDPQFGLDVSFYVYELPFYRGVARLRLRRRASSLARRDRHQLPVRRHPDQRPRGAHHALRPHPARHHRRRSTSPCRPSASGSTSTRRSPTTATLITGAAYTDVNAVIPGRLILAGIAAVVAVLVHRHGDRSAAGACRSSAPRCSSSRAS